MNDRHGPGAGWMVVVALLAAGALQAALPVTEHVLANGMRFLIIEDHTAPSVMGAWVAHVGSSNEVPGQTGLTHLLEHMMFKGSHTIGTKDLEKDLSLLARQEELKEQIRRRSRELRLQVRQGQQASLAEAQKKDPLCQQLETEFQQLVAAQRENMIPNEFDQIMQKNGQLFGNAFTSEDMTAYFNVLPANKLELWFWMESDRLINPVFREFYAERDVVYEERRMRTESTPTGVHEEAVNAIFWQASPYHWPVIGWPSDVSELSMAQAQDYYHTWYGPGNVTAILAGDLDTPEAIRLAERYFGRMEARQDPPPLVTLEPVQLGEKRYTGVAEVNPTVNLRYHCGGFKHVDSGVLEVVASLLSGDTGRLQRSLVQEGRQAVRAWAYYERNKHEGAFQVEAEAAAGVGNEALEAALDAELARLVAEPVPDRELQKVKNTWFVDTYRAQQSPIRAGFELIMNAGMGDWREQEAYAARIQAVSAADVQRVAGAMLRPENRMVTWWVRQEGAAAGPADELASLPAEVQGMARQFKTQMGLVTDRDMLQSILAQLAAEEPEDEQQRHLGQVLMGVVEARLAALEAKEENR
ncbi:MAG: pitrilysin family protein [bacterium]|jgi:predicted Zn-dependent peptidase|nr:pitrilysin family protein [bacterium]